MTESITLKFKDISSDTIEDVLNHFSQSENRKLSKTRILDYAENYPNVTCYSRNHFVGFAYTSRFAPDILELMNIYVIPEQRNQRIGIRIIDELYKRTDEKWKALILVNSLLYEGNKNKKYATSFYELNGFSEIFKTSNTIVHCKNLQQTS